MQDEAERLRMEGQRLALVPTMGALHEGHLALVHRAKELADHVTASIFVNPTQFGPGEDYERYPRQLHDDVEQLEEAGVDLVFAPSVAEMYPDGPENAFTRVTVAHLDERLCGRFRPGHFEGVTTVVSKLFHLCRPHVAVFGRKDAQQFVILRRMAKELFFGVEVVGVETVREEDGLARSSRNAYLTAAQREQAVALSRAVEAARTRILAGEQGVEALVETMRRELAAASDGEVQYAEVVDAERLQPVLRLEPGDEVLAAVAVYFGDTRLIDNAFVRVPHP